MSDTPAADSPATENTPSPAPGESRDDAQQRAAACGREIERVLSQHRCAIKSFIKPVESVGDGSKAMISTGHGIFPLA